MATAKIEVVGLGELPLIADMYRQVYQPARDVAYFQRRFQGRHHALILVASIEDRPVGFFIGFELKPNTFFGWLCGVLPDYRRQGIASQLLEALQAWATTENYDIVRFECHNQTRPMLHMAIAHGYDIVGVRWDSERASNLVIFEKLLSETLDE